MKMTLLLTLALVLMGCVSLPDNVHPSVSLLAPVNTNAAEFGSGAIFIAEVEVEATEKLSFRFMHKSYTHTGWPFTDGDCAPESVQFCESTFDAFGVVYRLEK